LIYSQNEISDPETVKKGDLIARNGHVIILIICGAEKILCNVLVGGTSQKDNGDNIMNNVVYGNINGIT
jgi:hypothetical protein